MDFAGAISFIRRVQLHSQIYEHFGRVMRDYSTDKLDVAAVISELDTLFQFHPDLLFGYRIFLPSQFRATLPYRQSRKQFVPDLKNLKRCIDFMNKVQKRLPDEQGIIGSYLETIRALTQGKLSNKEAYNAIAEIFGNENEDLVDEFSSFL